MTILFYCSNCAQALNVPDEAAGEQVRCPYCRTVQVVTSNVPLTPSQQYPQTTQTPITAPVSSTPSWRSPHPQDFEETGNPYQSPQEIEDEAYVEGDLVASKVRFGKLFDRIFALYKPHFGRMVLLGLIVGSINFFSGVLENIATNIAQQPGVPVATTITVMILGGLVTQMIQIWTSLGMLRVIVRFARGERDIAFSALFSDPVLTLKCFAVTFFQVLIASVPFLFTFPVLVPLWWPFRHNGPFEAQQDITLPVVVTVALCIPAFAAYLYLVARVLLADFFLFDRRQGIFQSIGSSWRFTSGNGWVIVLGMIVAGILTVVGVFVCCIGIIMTLAMYSTFAVMLYLMITGQPTVYDSGAPYGAAVEQW